MKTPIYLLIFLAFAITAAGCDEAIDKGEANVHYKVGVSLQNKGKLTDAVREFSKAITLNPDYAAAYIGRADAYSKLGKVQEANEDYSVAEKLSVLVEQ